MAMGFECGVRCGLFGGISRSIGTLRILVRGGEHDGMDRSEYRADGGEHGDRICNDGPCADDPGGVGTSSRGSLWSRFRPIDAILLVALIGLIAHGLIRDMTATTATMLSGLLGVLYGRFTKVDGNGNGKNR